MCAQATSGTDQSQPGWDNGGLFLSWVHSGVVKVGCGGCWSEGGRCVLGMGAVFQEGQPAVWRYSREQGWAGFNSVSWGKGRGDGLPDWEYARALAAQMQPLVQCWSHRPQGVGTPTFSESPSVPPPPSNPLQLLPFPSAPMVPHSFPPALAVTAPISSCVCLHPTGEGMGMGMW